MLSLLSAGLSLSHVLEAPGKAQLTFQEFVRVQHLFYGGYAIFGAVAWSFSVAAGLAAATGFYKRVPFICINSLLGVTCFAACFLLYFVFLSRYNAAIAAWNTIAPAGWRFVSSNWNRCHAAIFVINTAGSIFFLRVKGRIDLLSRQKGLPGTSSLND